MGRGSGVRGSDITEEILQQGEAENDLTGGFWSEAGGGLKRRDNQSGTDSVIESTTLESCDFLMTSAWHEEGFSVNRK